MAKDSIAGDAGEFLVCSQLSQLGFECDLYRHATSLDGEARFGDFALGKCLKVQVKTGDSYFRYDAGGDLFYYGKIKDLRYWSASPAPVIVVLVDLDHAKCYWQTVQEPIATGKGWKLRMDMRQTLTSHDAGDKLQRLVDFDEFRLAPSQVNAIANPWREVDRWPGDVMLYAHYNQVAAQPQVKYETTRTSNGTEIKTPVSAEIEVRDRTAPVRRVLPIPDPNFRARIDDNLAVIYGGHSADKLWRVGVVNLDADASHVDLINESVDHIYPLQASPFIWAAIPTILASLAAFLTGHLVFWLAAFVGFATCWHLLAPRRRFVAELRGRLAKAVAAIRADYSTSPE